MNTSALKRVCKTNFSGFCLLLLLGLPGGLSASDGHNHDHLQSSSQPELPVVEYIENVGQWDDEVLYRASIPGGALFICRDRLVYNMVDIYDLNKAHDLIHEDVSKDDIMIDFHAFALHFDQDLTTVIPEQEQELRRSYFLGNRSGSNARAFHQVSLMDVLPGVDMILGSMHGAPKYDLVLEAGVKLKDVVLRYTGLDGISLEEQELVLKTSVGDYHEMIPVATQHDKPVAIQFRQLDDEHFGFKGKIDPNLSLVIDPVLLGSSFSGQVGNSQYGFTSTYDDFGNIYGAGESFGAGFPTSTGAYSAAFSGGVDMAVTKFSPDATTVLYATYIGGSSTDNPHSMIVDPLTEELVIMGSTGSSNFPTTTGAYSETAFGGTDIVVTRLSSDGTALIGSTYIGGSGTDGVNSSSVLTPNYGDQNRGEVNLDDAGNIFIASVTGSSNYPTSATAVQPSSAGGQDGVVSAFSADLTSLLFSTYLGGSNDDNVAALKVKSGGEVVAVGGTRSADFPTTAGVLSSAGWGGGADGFVTELSADGSSILQSTYVGATDEEMVWFIELDAADDIYIAGNCAGGLFPITGSVYSEASSTQFIAKMESDFSNYQWSTLIGAGSGGGSMEMAPTAFLVDICSNIYLGGFTSDDMTITPDAYQPVQAGSGDFYFAVLAPDATSLLYGTYMGGSGWEHVDGGTSRYSKRGVLYQASCTSSTDFPTTTGSAYGGWTASGWDRIVFKFDFEFAGVSAASATASGLTYGCAPFTADFINSSTGATSYEWDFGDGGSSTDISPTYTFADTGSYVIQLIAKNDSSDCAGADTAYLTIEVHDDSLDAIFTTTEDCENLIVDFSNFSNYFPGTSWEWNFGDGSTSTTDINPSHTYTAPGTYTVELTLTDGLTCNGSDTYTLDVELLPTLVGGFDHLDAGCPPLAIDFTNDNAAPVSFDWDLGNGSSSTDTDPSVTYTEPGTYDVTLISADAATCNLADTVYSTVTVYTEPVSNFDSDPPAPDIFSAVNFSDLSTDPESWMWNFGDGNTSDQANPSHTFANPGTYTVCLTVLNEFGCEDVFCRDINVDANSQVGFPTAFSPNGDGENDIYIPIAEGMDDYMLRLFNRWGEVVFETTDPTIGWDGQINGTDQDVGTYVYILMATGIDGETYSERGNFYLVR